MKLSITMICHNDGVIMLSAVMLSVIMPSVIMLNVIMLSVVAPSDLLFFSSKFSVLDK
jgi:hypothetical protein